jgi:hypothetical protein
VIVSIVGGDLSVPSGTQLGFALSVRIENIFSKHGKFFDNKNHHARTTQITTIYHQFTMFCTPKTTPKLPYPQTLAL